MAFDFYMPDIGEGVVEGEIVGWKVKEGDHVKLDQPLVEVMTDKATVELPSPRAGVIKKINFKDGDICPVGKVLVVIEEEAAASTGNGKKAPAVVADEPPRAHAAPQQQAKVAQNVPVSTRGATSGGIEVVDATTERERVLATPATRRLARELGVEIGRVPATGKHGRVTTEDVKRFKDQPAPAAQQAKSYTPVSVAKGGDEERIPLRGIRKRIAESMSRSKQTAAHFTYVEEIDMTELVTVRDRAKSRAAERGVKLNYLPFIVKAVVSGLKKWPMLNA
jgi:pyruvate dehydrogenase E2 component (dihydrolipoamide acetyltransferase)